MMDPRPSGLVGEPGEPAGAPSAGWVGVARPPGRSRVDPYACGPVGAAPPVRPPERPACRAALRKAQKVRAPSPRLVDCVVSTSVSKSRARVSRGSAATF